MGKAINKAIVERGFNRLPAIPELIKKRNVQGIMQMLQSDEMKRGISYMSKPEGSPAWQTQKEILSTMSDVGAYNNQRKWVKAQQSYDELMALSASGSRRLTSEDCTRVCEERGEIL